MHASLAHLFLPLSDDISEIEMKSRCLHRLGRLHLWLHLRLPTEDVVRHHLAVLSWALILQLTNLVRLELRPWPELLIDNHTFVLEAINRVEGLHEDRAVHLDVSHRPSVDPLRPLLPVPQIL